MRQLLLAPFALLALAPGARAADDPPAWVKPMKAVHAKFTGKPGTLALFGDSITDSLAFWAPLEYAPKEVPAEIAKSLDVVKKHMIADCWRKWRGGAYGNEGRQTAQWAEDNIDAWLKKLNPECAVIMFGTNDLNGSDEKTYDKRMRAVVEKCLKNGTVVILTTIPPRAGQEEKAKAFAEVARKIATDLKLPLVDYYAEILKRRPDDWNGALPKFKAFEKDVYQVPTLISADGVHPSAPSKFADYSAEALKNNGYQLRSVLTLHAYADVIARVLTAKDR
ncbi:MAG: SGNH/GDSL hydrolase family protein [Planctomycetes bacterium]|nr:SGNH/GDSL hydrolase family protein [Planctomycetota bacterium]